MYINICLIIIIVKEVINIKEKGEGCMWVFWGKNGKEIGYNDKVSIYRKFEKYIIMFLFIIR